MKYTNSFLDFFKQHRAECITYMLFLWLAVFGFAVHEFWYDEAQAWQIAKTASWQDILFTIPHYEGHPPFWHLLLAVPAKLGLSWQWGVGIVGFLLMAANGFLLIFKAPFPRWVRLCLPFSYFLFYQYGIMVRPYSVMTLVMLLLALYFPQKDKRPGLFVSLLAVLCACHIFGVAIAGGITLAWLWQMRAGRPWKTYLGSLYKDTRFRYLLVLLGWVVLLFVSMRQAQGSPLANYLAFTLSVPKHAIYLLFAMPADTVLMNLGRMTYLMHDQPAWVALLGSSVFGLLMWALVFICLPRKNWMYLVLPYLCLFFIMLHYVSRHHIGLALLLGIWYAWIALDQHAQMPKVPRLFQRIGKLLVGLGCVVPILWTLGILGMDAKYPLFPGKDMVAFLEKYHLTDKTVFVAWEVRGAREFAEADPHFIPVAVLLNMYTRHNIVANFHNGEDKGYVINVYSAPDELKKTVQQWRERGLPDVLIGAAALDMLYADQPEILSKYRAAYVAPSYHIWKLDRPRTQEMVIYLREDWWDKYKDQILAEAGQQPS